jgi:predicted MFS family arabinose efflux permease
MMTTTSSPLSNKTSAGTAIAEVESHNQPESNHVLFLSLSYMFAMGVCGIVLVAIGSTLEDLSELVGQKATDLGGLFIDRGMGQILGAILSSKLYRWFDGNHVLVFVLLVTSVMLIRMPFCSDLLELRAEFFSLGLCTATIDTGCQIMTRKLHGRKAGPWLGSNAVAFGFSACIVPIIAAIDAKLNDQYFIMSAIVALVSLPLFFGAKAEDDENIALLQELHIEGIDSSNIDQLVPHYYVEATIAVMLFCFVGGGVAITAYLTSYVNQTHIVVTSHKAWLLLVLWIAVTVGRLIGVLDQRYLTKPALYSHLSIMCIGGSLAMLLMIARPQSAQAAWVGVALYGVFHGPTVGYCYDLNNRLTLPTEKSMAIVMFGLNLGASFVPYLATVAWRLSDNNPESIIVVTGLSMLLPLPMLYATKLLSYNMEVPEFYTHRNNTLHGYHALSEKISPAESISEDHNEEKL